MVGHGRTCPEVLLPHGCFSPRNGSSGGKTGRSWGKTVKNDSWGKNRAILGEKKGDSGAKNVAGLFFTQ